jgi:hypothetical protein
MDILELCKFLVKAKINTYASGKEGNILTDESKELTFEEGEFVYRDRYYGFNPFIGEEVVFRKGKCTWGMNYYGYTILLENISQKEVYEFLRKALKMVREEKPFRGPDEYEENSFKYVNNVEGDVSRFNGTERIFYNGKEIYRLLYLGGYIKGEV